MMKSMAQLIILFLSIISSLIAYGDGSSGVAVETDLGRSTQLTSFAGAGTIENTASYMDIKLTYQWPIGMYIGGKYSTLQNITSFGNGYRSGTAVVVGYRLSGFYADFSYYLFSSFERGNGFVYDSGSSYGGSCGYNMTIISSMYLGLGVVYNSYNWTQSQFGSVKTIANNSMIDIYPSLNIGYNF